MTVNQDLLKSSLLELRLNKTYTDGNTVIRNIDIFLKLLVLNIL